MSAAILQALRSVAELRADASAVAEALKIKRAQFAEENEALLEHEKNTRLQLEEAEQATKELVLAHYNTTEDAAPVPGAVQVKLFTVLKYDADRALAWATEKQMAIIPAKLDVKAFEKIAQATSLDFVSIEKEPRVTLATKLDPKLFDWDEETAVA